MSYKTEFPAEYHDVPSVILDLVTSGLMEDASWHNDTNPHFEFDMNDDFQGEPAVAVWFDAPNPEDREMKPIKRYLVFVREQCVLATDDADGAAFLARTLIAALKESNLTPRQPMSNGQAFNIVRNMAKLVVRGNREAEAVARMDSFDVDDLFPLDDTQDADGLTVGFSAPARDQAVDAVARAFSEIVRRDLADHLEEINRKNISLHEYCDANMLMGEAFKKVMGREDDTASELDGDIWNNAWAKARVAHYSL